MVRCQNGDVVVLAPKGYLTGGEETEALQQVLRCLSEEGNLRLVINLTDAQHLNSLALDVLEEAWHDYAQRGGIVSLCGLNDRVTSVFARAKFSCVFTVYPSEELAVASFAANKD